jgi:hypothetical protein
MPGNVPATSGARRRHRGLWGHLVARDRRYRTVVLFIATLLVAAVGVSGVVLAFGLVG